MKNDPASVDIAFSQTPSSMINRLLPIITTDATIANYVNAHFGTKVTAGRIAELRKLRGEPFVTDHGPAIASDYTQFKAAAKDSADRLLRAIRQHHPDKAA